ncbi:hypothetical protein AYJ57_15255 [Salipiger sp. CCB-MM3]|uniref:DUF6361 family protein n=1 Tax=Salipiger sp. CCB-MM3 TaxID=1792508 RepID=UPI00080AC0E5|nr:DUF6361 family protein [Salipiger sp. CCB-MM3]ANT61823.1 hypothetical protein AYJ57_15255 [Salipiger sp. CCB-MM3]
MTVAHKGFFDLSALGWVSFGKAEAEAVQTLIGALSDSEARDELGLGSIRDGFSDLLFPGTSTVQTRLRYFLFLPQIFRELDLKRGDRKTRLREGEAALITRLQSLPEADTWLLIGSEAGEKLKRMPSAVYWGGLGLWGVRSPAFARAGIGEVLDRMAEGEACWEECPSIAASDSRGFALTCEEADWISDRCSSIRHGGTLLGYLMARAGKLKEHRDLGSLAEIDLPPSMQQVLNHALAFAETMHGAALLYNLMLAEHFSHDAQEVHANELRKWRQREQFGLPTSARDLIAPLLKQGPLVGFNPKQPTLRFIDDWIGVMGEPEGPAARALITRREIETKGSRARLRFVPQDYRWNGSSGAGQIQYRWGVVRRYLDDMAAAA